MIRYYSDYSDDFVETKNQSKELPKNYKWIKKNPLYILCGAIIFRILQLVGLVYGKFALHLKIVGKEKLKNYKKSANEKSADKKISGETTSKSTVRKSGYFIIANHTLPLGDVFNPALYNPVHPYYICDTSNLGIPILGPILPMVGALPIPNSIRDKKKLFDAISKRAQQGKAIVIYPEAHVWPYYTDIRPFENTAFNFSVRENLPIFTATTTFQKPKNHHKKPQATIYIDGPFYPDTSLDKKDRIQKLHDEAFSVLKSRAKESTYSHIEYRKKSLSKNQG